MKHLIAPSLLSANFLDLRKEMEMINKSDAYVLERAHRLGVPCNVFTKEDWIAGDEILAVLQESNLKVLIR